MPTFQSKLAASASLTAISRASAGQPPLRNRTWSQKPSRHVNGPVGEYVAPGRLSTATRPLGVGGSR